MRPRYLLGLLVSATLIAAAQAHEHKSDLIDAPELSAYEHVPVAEAQVQLSMLELATLPTFSYETSGATTIAALSLRSGTEDLLQRPSTTRGQYLIERLRVRMNRSRAWSFDRHSEVWRT